MGEATQTPYCDARTKLRAAGCLLKHVLALPMIARRLRHRPGATGKGSPSGRFKADSSLRDYVEEVGAGQTQGAWARQSSAE